jgi:Do/DeqQ family serine protease
MQRFQSFIGGILGGVLILFIYHFLLPSEKNIKIRPVDYEKYENPIDFTKPSSIGKQSVVSIKSRSQKVMRNNFWDFWDFWGNQREATNAGTGVIYSSDGLIVTNFHVIENAEEITVTLPNKRSFKAQIVGTDPSSDLAVLKIQANNLKPIALGNSDELLIGEWVLAIGNPFELTSTVTAGIVSAKGRNINLVKTQFPIESFIQTDAAINPGNSGGPLINTKGELIGINTAIMSNSGAYNGYGFAIPVNIVKKVVRDLLEYQVVQRSFYGGTVEDIDENFAKSQQLENYFGVYISEIYPDGSLDKAKLELGDVILKVNQRDILSKADFYEAIALTRPGDLVKLQVQRKNKIFEVNLTLQNEDGETKIVKKTSIFSKSLGAELQPLTKFEKNRLKIDSGFKIISLTQGRLAQMRLPEGFIIYRVNNQPINSINELEDALNQRGRVLIEGFHKDGSRGTYSFFSY